MFVYKLLDIKIGQYWFWSKYNIWCLRERDSAQIFKVFSSYNVVTFIVVHHLLLLSCMWLFCVWCVDLKSNIFQNVSVYNTGPTPSIMVWDAMSYNFHWPLVLCREHWISRILFNVFCNDFHNRKASCYLSKTTPAHIFNRLYKIFNNFHDQHNHQTWLYLDQDDV